MVAQLLRIAILILTRVYMACVWNQKVVHLGKQPKTSTQVPLCGRYNKFSLSLSLTLIINNN